MHYSIVAVFGASLSEPHTSESSGTSVAFTKIYEVIRLHLQTFTLKNG